LSILIFFFNMKAILCMPFFLFLVCGAATAADWDKAAMEARAALEGAVENYSDGKPDEAGRRVSNAYFDVFEGSGMEAAVAAKIGEERKTELEGLFSELRSAISNGAPLSAVIEKKERLVGELKRDAATLGGASSPYASFFSSFIIIAREGFEAILIIGAIAAYLRKTGNAARVPVIYRGALLAVLASILTAALFSTVIKIGAQSMEALEGVTMLLATAVLFYVSWWLLSKSQLEKWHGYIKERIEKGVSKGSLFALGATSFMVVYREGAETILFYSALLADASSSPSAVAAGFLAGCLFLVVVFLAIRVFSIRIPLRPFFLATSLVLYYLAFRFSGMGVHELQEAGWIPATYMDGLPGVPLFGFYPTWQGAALQGALGLLFIFAVLWSAFTVRRKVQAP
jgi:high-affinity iron transporter